MSAEDITLEAADGGRFGAYLATPASGTGPGLVVFQEIFGVNQVMRDIADGFAEDGYVAVVPDLFWRQEPGVRLTDRTEAEWERAFELMQGFDQDLGIEDSKAALAHLRTLPGCSGTVGCVGYCLGGKLAYLMATRSDVDASVGYYGVQIDAVLDEARNIQKPLMLHVAGRDQFVPPEAQATIKDALKDNPLVTIHTYPDCDHAFARVGGEHYDETAARAANARTREFFAAHLA